MTKENTLCNMVNGNHQKHRLCFQRSKIAQIELTFETYHIFGTHSYGSVN